jgi:hemolysin III
MGKYRDPVSGFSHLAGAIASLIGIVGLLLASSGQPVKEISFLIYGFGLVIMFSASATYHLVNGSPGVVGILRKIDHSAIYLLIAGTYTPICLSFFNGFWRWGLLAIIWCIALVGLGIKVFVIHASRWINTGIYLVMGWLAIMGLGEIFHVMPPGAIVWLVVGGLFFTLGAVVYVIQKPDPWPGILGFHEIWHIFVLLGCLSHFMLMAGYVLPYIGHF